VSGQGTNGTAKFNSTQVPNDQTISDKYRTRIQLTKNIKIHKANNILNSILPKVQN